jgi:4-hydroxybenzoate polyprenyltransferase
MKKKIKGYIKILRPRAWTKNLFIFGAILFANKFFDAQLVLRNITGFFVFCFLSGTVYILNDYMDAKLDRLDPNKCTRPIAAGTISKTGALIFFFILVTLSLGAAYYLDHKFFYLSISYLAINIAYSTYLKRVVLIDIIIVSFGFFIRALAGAFIINTPPSLWFLVTTFFLASLLATSKRRFEFLLFADKEPDKKKAVLNDYSERLLDQMISISATASVLSYSIYTITGALIHKLVWTIPLVLYGIFRYLYIVYKKGEGGSPEKVFLNDPHILGTVGIFGLMVAAIFVYF